MNIIDLNSLRPARERAVLFEGQDYGAKTTFFLVNSLPGRGVNKHRHPYEEIFVVLSDNIEAIIDGEKQMLNNGVAVVIPPKTWHEFTNRADNNALMVTIHSSPKLVQEDWENA
jgi:quercetin dioxygenase-like cupin family protein